MEVELIMPITEFSIIDIPQSKTFISKNHSKTNEIQYSILLCDIDPNWKNNNTIFPVPIKKLKFSESDISTWKKEYQDAYNKAVKSLQADEKYQSIYSEKSTKNTPLYITRFPDPETPEEKEKRRKQHLENIERIKRRNEHSFATKHVEWEWLNQKVPDWEKRIVDFRKIVMNKFKLNANCHINVFLSKSDWKLFKERKYNEIELENK